MVGDSRCGGARAHATSSPAGSRIPEDASRFQAKAPGWGESQIAARRLPALREEVNGTNPGTRPRFPIEGGILIRAPAPANNYNEKSPDYLRLAPRRGEIGFHRPRGSQENGCRSKRTPLVNGSRSGRSRPFPSLIVVWRAR